MSNLKSQLNSRSNSTSPFAGRNKSVRPSTQENNLYNQAMTAKNNYGDTHYKTKLYGQSFKEPTPPRNLKSFGRTFYPKSNHNIIYESGNNPFDYDEMMNSGIHANEQYRKVHPNQENLDLNSRENKFKTLNVRSDYNTIHQNDDSIKSNKMITISPGEYTGKDLKARVMEQIKKTFKKTEYNQKNSNLNIQKIPRNEKSSISRNRSKESAEQTSFPVIGQSRKNIQDSGNDRMILVENIYTVNPNLRFHYREAEYNSIISKIEERRTKSSLRHASVLRSRAPVDQHRRAVSNQKSSNHRLEDQKLIKLKNLGEEFPAFENGSFIENPKEKNAAVISLAGQGNPKVYMPRPPSGERNQKPRSRSSSRPIDQKGHLKERTSKFVNMKNLNNSDIVGSHYPRDSAVPRANLITTEQTQPNANTEYSYYTTEERDVTRGIAHYKTQPILEERDYDTVHQMQNNKSIDDGLRKTVDSQHEISYCDKARNNDKSHPIEISTNFVVSPPCDYKRGRFVRKLKEATNGIKREESSKNLLDEFAEKSIKYSSEEQTSVLPPKRDVSKSPFDDLLETSLRSYEQDSIVRSRTKKEIEMTISMTKNPIFKRSKVIVSKGYNGSTEKDGHMTSTNVTNSKSTYKNESIQSNLKDELFSIDPSTSKKDMEIDFGFEDDLSLTKKKSSNEPRLFNLSNPPKKSALQLNVIAEETNQNNQKETIAASEDVINSEEFQKIVTTDDHMTLTSPSSKKSTIKPLYFNCGNKLYKTEVPEKKSAMSQKLLDDDDICVNGENSDIDDVINSRLDLNHSADMPNFDSDDKEITRTITHSQNV